MNRFSHSAAVGCASLLAPVAYQTESQASAAACSCSVGRVCLAAGPLRCCMCYLMYYWELQSTERSCWTDGIDEYDGFNEIAAKSGSARGYSSSFAAISGTGPALVVGGFAGHT